MPISTRTREPNQRRSPRMSLRELSRMGTRMNLNLINMILLKILFTVIFFLVLTPVGLILRLFGVDYLNTKNQSKKSSYWIEKK